MYDTIEILSPCIGEEMINFIENNFCISRMCINNKDNELIYHFVTSDLKKSSDRDISFIIVRSKYVYEPRIQRAIKVDCEPMIKLSLSVHKLIVGHNLNSGSDNLLVCARYVVSMLEEKLEIKLPLAENWEVLRIDYAKNFKLDSEKAMDDFFFYYRNAYYPKRKPRIYDGSIMWSSRLNTVKFYDKYKEFMKCDYKHLNMVMKDEIRHKFLSQLMEETKFVLRVEVGIRKRFLKDYMKKSIILVKDITLDMVEKIWSDEVEKVMKERSGDVMKIVYKTDDVNTRLIDFYGKRKASSLFSTWTKLTTLGQIKTKDSMSKTSYYRHIEDLINAHVSLYVSDLIMMDESYNLFVPSLQSENIVNKKSNYVLEIEKRFEVA